MVKVGSTLRSCFLQLYCIIYRIVQNPMLDHFIMLVVLFDTSTLMAQTFQGVTVRTDWCLSAVDSCLLVFYVTEAVFKILVQGRTNFRNPWNDLDFFIVLMCLVDFTLLLVQSAGGFGSRHASTLFQVLKTLKGARVFRALRLLKAIRLFIAVLVDNFQLSIRKKKLCKSQKSPDVKEGETQSSEKAVEGKKIELICRHLQLLAAMDQHMQKYRSQACLLDNLVETFFTDRDEETRSDVVE
ncbi:hypothetical protein AOLI_G00026060 [Acnodon oligacanthus]